MKESYPVTKKGYELLKKELKQLINTDRSAVVIAISTAREHGDLKENAEYHAAKEQQAQLESRVIEINNVIAIANVIDIKKIEPSDKVIFSSTVELLDLDTNTKKIYKIVGKDEADINSNLLYYKSPIGKALIGKKKKDYIVVNTPSGEKTFEINNVKYI